MVALTADGDLRPTAPRIAERAGVSLRSVFQHFTDLDALFAAAADREISRIAARVRTIDPMGALEDRIEAFVAQRARVLEQVTPARRVALVHETSSAALAGIRDRLLALARAEIERTFQPELSARPAKDRRQLLDALDATTSWQMWEALRTHQRLEPAPARSIVTRILTALLT